MIILDRAQFLDHVRVGTVFWYLCSHDGEYTLHGPHIVEKFTAPGQDFPMWRVLTWLISISDQRIFGAQKKIQRSSFRSSLLWTISSATAGWS